MHRRERAKRHGLAAGAAHADLEHVLGVEPIGGIRLRRDAEDAPEQIEVVDVGGAEIGLQRAEHVGHVDAQQLRLVRSMSR